MIGYLPFVVWFALLVYCILDLDRAPTGSARGLPVHWWFVLVVAVPIAGAVAWLLWGRPTGRVAAATAAPAVAAGPTRLPADAPGRAHPHVGAGPEVERSLRAELERIDREFEEAVRRSLSRGLPPSPDDRPDVPLPS